MNNRLKNFRKLRRSRAGATETIEQQRDLRNLALDLNSNINKLEECAVTIVSRGQLAVQLALKIGDGLRKAKELKPHGDFGPWLKQNCPRISRTYANYFMRCALVTEGVDTSGLKGIHELLVFSGVVKVTEKGKPEGRPFCLAIALRYVKPLAHLSMDAVRQLPHAERPALLQHVESTIQTLTTVRLFLAAPASS
jgi:hypothetical protein